MRPRVELSLAIGVIAVGVLLLLGVLRIGAGAGYDRIGPRFFPSLWGPASWYSVVGMRSPRAEPAPWSGSFRNASRPSIELDGVRISDPVVRAMARAAEPVGFVVASSVQFGWSRARFAVGEQFVMLSWLSSCAWSCISRSREDWPGLPSGWAF